MKHIILAASVVFTTPAFAGSIVIGAQSASPAVNASKTYNFSDANMARFYTFVQSAYPTVPCTPTPPETTCTPTPATRLQSLSMWADAIIAGTVANVISSEREKARATITDSPMTQQ